MLLCTLLFLPINGILFFNFIFGGILAVYLFRKEKKSTDDLKLSDVLILGIGTGILAGSILSLMMTFILQDITFRKTLVEMINKSSKMNTSAELFLLEDFGSFFCIILSVFTIITSSIFTSFGTMICLPFYKQRRK
jgi:hypothetical protein